MPDPQRTVSNASSREKHTKSVDKAIKMARSGLIKPWFRSKTLSILVILWALFTACLGIMMVVIFVQPQWISGKHPERDTNVNFGLYRNCTDTLDDCTGSLTEFSKIYSTAWQASTVFVAFAFSTTFVSVILMLFYWMCCYETSGLGFRISSGMQAFAGLCMLITCFVYPAGWDAPAVKSICGSEADVFKIGTCEVKWAYWIALICMIDAFVLSYLSFMFIEREIGTTPSVTSSKRSSSTNTDDGESGRRFSSNGYINRHTTQL